MSDLVQVEIDGPAAYVTLNRPDEQNKITYAMMRALVSALEQAKDSDILVVRANGDDFCLGRDQSEKPEGVTPAQNLGAISEVNALVDGFAGVSISLVRGRAVGFGSGLAAQCDLTVASVTAQLGFDEISHGFPPLVVQTWLTRYVSRKVALDLVLTGRRVPAAEAKELGLVTRVVQDAELDAVGAAIVAGLSASNASALRRAKSFLNEIDDVPLADRGAHGVSELVAWRKANA